MTILVPIALFGWIPGILIFFSALPPRRAILVSFLVGWLFLPCAGYDIPGFPNYTKLSATCLGVLLGTAVFHIDLLFALRPRWFDLPMATWCLCPIASSLSNELGLYDGLSESFNYFMMWGLPYLIGRVYFTRLEHLQEIALGIVVGGLIYVPFCLWEMKMSPQLHRTLYGFWPRAFGELTYGGWRPQVFMSCSLELGFWMAVTAMTSFWLWASGGIKQLWGCSFGWLVVALLVTAVLCRGTGAWVLLFLGVSLCSFLKWSGSTRPALVLILLPVLYMAIRASGLWTGQSAVNLTRTVLNERRAQSLAFRMRNEDILVAKALQQPVFGWGGWGRAFVFDVQQNNISITDGMWVIALGNNGLTGLISFNVALLLPMVLLVRSYPARAWLTPTLAPGSALAIVANLYSIDCIPNAMINPIYILVLGGVTGILGARDRRGRSQVESDGTDLSGLLEDLYNSTNHRTIPCDSGQLAGSDPREEAAIRLGALGRSLIDHGMVREAEEAFDSALQYWAELAAEYPNDLEYRKCWLDGLNDSAWTLITHPGLEDRDVLRAIQLAEQTVGLEPEGATYWNTLGIAYFRARDSKAAIHALERSTELSTGGTTFDHFFLAMAYWQEGDREQARHWYLRGNAWMEEHNPDHEDLLRFRAEAASLLDSYATSL